MTHKKNLFCKKQIMRLWENYAIATTKVYKHHLKTFINLYKFSNLLIFREKKSVPNSILALSWDLKLTKKIWIGTCPNPKTKKKNESVPDLKSKPKSFEICHSVIVFIMFVLLFTLDFNREFHMDNAYCVNLNNYPWFFITFLVPLVPWYTTFICTAWIHDWVCLFCCCFLSVSWLV